MTVEEKIEPIGDEILLIGNGPSVTKLKMGSAIDGFPLVARFNSFRLNGFSEYVGSNCHIWITCDFFPAYQKLYNYKEIFYVSFNHRLDNPEFLAFKTQVPIAQMFPDWVWKETCNLMEYDAPSSGAVAAYYFSKLYKVVYLYGFDFFQREQHHYGDKVERGPNHRPDKELEFFKRLMREEDVLQFRDTLLVEDN